MTAESTRRERASAPSAIARPRPSRRRAISSAPSRAASRSQFAWLPTTWAASDGVKPHRWTRPRATSLSSVAAEARRRGGHPPGRRGPRRPADRRARRDRAGLWVAVALTAAVVAAAGWSRDRVGREYQREAAAAAATDQARVESRAASPPGQTRADAEVQSARDAAVQQIRMADDLRDRFRFADGRPGRDPGRKPRRPRRGRRPPPGSARAKAHLDTVRAPGRGPDEAVGVGAREGRPRPVRRRLRRLPRRVRRRRPRPGGRRDRRDSTAKVADSPIKGHLVAALYDWAADRTRPGDPGRGCWRWPGWPTPGRGPTASGTSTSAPTAPGSPPWRTTPTRRSSRRRSWCRWPA